MYLNTDIFKYFILILLCICCSANGYYIIIYVWFI